MVLAAKLDEYGRPAWIAVTVLGFAVWWPLGLATLAYAVASGRLLRGMRGKFERWSDGHWGCDRGSGWQAADQPGVNRAFDEYRDATLRRLEEEERDFREFLDRLRMARDKAEFDQFLAERRRNEA